MELSKFDWEIKKAKKLSWIAKKAPRRTDGKFASKHLKKILMEIHDTSPSGLEERIKTELYELRSRIENIEGFLNL